MKSTSFIIAGIAVSLLPSAYSAGIIALVDVSPGIQAISRFDSAAPEVAASSTITGLGAGETLYGIDFRPATGELFGLSSGSSLYTINTTTGAASLVGGGFVAVALGGSSYGFDFNPTIDRIRIVGNDDTNNVGNPNDGNATAATAVFYGAGDINEGMNPNVVHHAYTNNTFGLPAPMASQLFGIDSNLDILVTQANSAGTLATVGSLGVDATDMGGFDIGPDGTANAAFTDGSGAATLYAINLGTGAATSIGGINGIVTGLTVMPEPSAVVLLGLGSLALFSRRRRI